MSNVGKKIDLPATFEKKQFINKETGESREYWAVSVLLEGQLVKLDIPKEQRPLITYILDRYEDKE